MCKEAFTITEKKKKKKESGKEKIHTNVSTRQKEIAAWGRGPRKVWGKIACI